MKEFLKKYWENLGISNEVIKAFLEVPREEFLLQKYKKSLMKTLLYLVLKAKQYLNQLQLQ